MPKRVTWSNASAQLLQVPPRLVPGRKWLDLTCQGQVECRRYHLEWEDYAAFKLRIVADSGWSLVVPFGLPHACPLECAHFWEMEILSWGRRMIRWPDGTYSLAQGNDHHGNSRFLEFHII